MELGNILTKRIFSDTSTIRIMDDFEQRDSKLKKIYDTLLLEDTFYIKYCRQLFSVSLYIQRRPSKLDYNISRLTFTRLKKEVLDNVFDSQKEYRSVLIQTVIEQFNQTVLVNNIIQQEIFFNTPIEFNAQNSSNRCGYGNRYIGETLVYEGTLYGETTDYMIVGARYMRIQ